MNNDIEKKIKLSEIDNPTLSESQLHKHLQSVKEKANETLLCSTVHNRDLISKSSIPVSPEILPISLVTLPLSAATDTTIASVVSQIRSPETVLPNTSTPYVSKNGQGRLSIDNISPITRCPAITISAGAAETSADSHYIPKSIYSAICDVSKISKTQHKLIGTWSRRKNNHYKVNRKVIARNTLKDCDEHTNPLIKSVSIDQKHNNGLIQTNLDNSFLFASVNNDVQATNKEGVDSKTRSISCYSEKNVSKEIPNEIPETNEGGPETQSFANNDPNNEKISINKTLSPSSNPCVSPITLCSSSPNGSVILVESKENKAENRNGVKAKNAGKDNIEKTSTVSNLTSMNHQIIDNAISIANDKVLKTKITSKDKLSLIADSFDSILNKKISKGISKEILKNASEEDTGSSSFNNNDNENNSIGSSLCAFSENPNTYHNPPGLSKVLCTSSRLSCPSPNSTISTLNSPESHSFSEKDCSDKQPHYDNVSFFSRSDKLQKLEDRMLGKETERIFKFRRYSRGRGRREINFSKSDVIDSSTRRKIELSSSSMTNSSANISELFLTDKVSDISVCFNSGEVEEQQQSRNIIGLEQENNMNITESPSRKVQFVDEYDPKSATNENVSKSSTNENKIVNIECSPKILTDSLKRSKFHYGSSKITFIEKEKHYSASSNQHNNIVVPKILPEEKQEYMTRKYRLIKPKPVPTFVKTSEISDSKLNYLLPCSKNILSPNLEVDHCKRLGMSIIQNEEKKVTESHKKHNLNLEPCNIDVITIDEERSQRKKTSLKTYKKCLTWKPQRNMQRKIERSKFIRNNIPIEDIAQTTKVVVSGQSKIRRKRIRNNICKESAESTKVEVSCQTKPSTESLNTSTTNLEACESFIVDPESCIISWLKDNYKQKSKNYLIQDQVYRHFVKAMHSMGKISGYNGNGLSLLDPILVASCVLKVFKKVRLENDAADRWGIYNGLAKLPCKVIKGKKENLTGKKIKS